MTANRKKKFILSTWQGDTIETEKSLKQWVDFNKQNENIEYEVKEFHEIPRHKSRAYHGKSKKWSEPKGR